MGNIRRKHSSQFKAKVALDMIKEIDTVSTISSKYSIHPTQASEWKKQAIDGITNQFMSSNKTNELKEKDELIDELYKQVGQLKVELDWLKKKSEMF